MARKLITSKRELSRITASLKKKKKKIVFTNGCFDILHPGHIMLLKKAKKHGDVLFVGLNSDRSVKKIKGLKRPIFCQRARAAILSAVEHVDYIAFFNELTPVRLIKAIVPDVLIKGSDWKTRDIAGADIVKKNKGKIARITLKKGFSTSNVIETIRKKYSRK